MSFFDVKPKRKNFSKTTQREALERQGGKCGKCRKAFTKLNPPEADHKNGKNWQNGVSNCLMLHAGCHSAKSRKQTTTRAKTTRTKKKGTKAVKIGDFSF